MQLPVISWITRVIRTLGLSFRRALTQRCVWGGMGSDVPGILGFRPDVPIVLAGASHERG